MLAALLRHSRSDHTQVLLYCMYTDLPIANCELESVNWTSFFHLCRKKHSKVYR